jgi:hypothetical protein
MWRLRGVEAMSDGRNSVSWKSHDLTPARDMAEQTVPIGEAGHIIAG